MALELPDWAGQQQQQHAVPVRRSSSEDTDGDATSAASGDDVPTGVSVQPLLAGAHTSSAAELLYTRGPSQHAGGSINGGGPVGVHSSALMHSSGESAADSSSAEQAVGAPIVVGHNLHKTYLLGLEGVPALRGVSVSIARGEFIAILGSSGGGKTSLLNILGTIDQPTKGDLSICGHRITSNTSDEEFAFLRLNKIGFVFQTFNLLPSMTAEENVSLPMVLSGRLSASEISARARDLLDRVGLADRMDHLPSQLSGGEQQRVTIARAIANKPDILLLDEPTGDLDQLNGTLILSLLLHLNRRERITCIMVTHDTQLKTYAHRVMHMVDGKLARLEVITPQARRDMDQQLERKVKQIRGEYSGELPVRSQPTTEFRDAADYASFLRADEDDD